MIISNKCVLRASQYIHSIRLTVLVCAPRVCVMLLLLLMYAAKYACEWRVNNKQVLTYTHTRARHAHILTQRRVNSPSATATLCQSSVSNEQKQLQNRKRRNNNLVFRSFLVLNFNSVLTIRAHIANSYTHSTKQQWPVSLSVSLCTTVCCEFRARITFIYICIFFSLNNFRFSQQQ